MTDLGCTDSQHHGRSTNTIRGHSFRKRLPDFAPQTVPIRRNHGCGQWQGLGSFGGSPLLTFPHFSHPASASSLGRGRGRRCLRSVPTRGAVFGFLHSPLFSSTFLLPSTTANKSQRGSRFLFSRLPHLFHLLTRE
jgi:hypothetical protein